MTEKKLDIEKLLLPINEATPEGVDVREDKKSQYLYYDLRALRQKLRKQQDDLLLAEDENTTPPDWQPLIDGAINLLSQQSKDIEVACWLIEGIVRKQGFLGLFDGITLLIQLIEKYKKELYPKPDEEGETNRLQAIIALNGGATLGTLIAPLNLSELLTSNGESINTWSLHQLEKNDEALQSIANGSTADDIEAKKILIAQIKQQLAALQDIVDTHYGNDVLSLHKLQEQLELSQTILSRLEKYLLVESNDETSLSINEKTKENKIITDDRKTATIAIEKALEYYQEKEPHSPINFLLLRVLRWQKSNLTDIFDEILADDEMKLDVSRVLGIPMEEND